MDVHGIAELLKRTLDPASRSAAETDLANMQKIIGFCPFLLQVVMNESVDLSVRQAGVIYFKNLVQQHWMEKEFDPKEDTTMPFSIHEQDRAVIRDNIVEAAVRATSDVIRLQLGLCISQLVKHDFPGRWPQVVDKVSLFLQTPEPPLWPGALMAFYQLVKNYEYKKKEDRAPLYDAMNLLLPQAYNLMAQCAGNEAAAAAELRKQILKIFFSLTQYVLPLELLSKEFFTQWMEVCNGVILSAIPASVNEVDKEERPALIWWKEKKWALHILTRTFERYGSPGNVLSEYKDFSEWFIKTFSHGIFESIFKLLATYYSDTYLSPRVLHLALNYINTGISHSITWKIVKPHVPQLIKDIIFPLMSYTPEDEELWNTDPYEYIRIKFDIFEDFVSPVTAAQTLLHSICKKRKDALPQTMEFLLKVLQNPESTSAQKDGALHMIGTLADILLKKRAYKGQMEEFLVQLVFPEFNSTFGHMRARACWMLHYFADVTFKNQNVLIDAFKLTIQCLLHDREVPVKVEAAIALQMLLTSQEETAKLVVEPEIGNITMELLQIIRDTENDDLNTVMQKIVCTYTEKLIPLATNICSHLVTTFAQVLETGDDNDDKSITAMGLLNTMETILSVFESREDVHAALEPIVLQAVHHIFTNSVIEFYEEALSLSCDLTTVKISPNMWNMLAIISEVFLKDGVDYFIDMMPLLHNYVTVDTDQFLSNPAYLTALFNMSKAMLNSDPGEDPECHAAKLLEVIILQCKGKQVDQFVTSAVEIALTRLRREIKTSELRTMCLQVAIAAFYYDAELFFGVLQRAGAAEAADNNGHAVIRHFIEQWLSDTDCFIGLHDRKLCIVGLCNLLNMPAVPGVAENAIRFLPSLILLFEGLKRAYESQHEDSSGEETSDDDESVDGECLESDEDEIDETSQMYLESLQKKITNAAGELKVTASIENYSDDEDEDIYEETSLEGYTTPLDDENSGVDEYELFKNVMEGIEKNNKEWYALLVNQLSADDAKIIQEIMTLCAQRKAMKESKSIELAGGYSFQQQSVPNQFSFITEDAKSPFGK